MKIACDLCGNIPATSISFFHDRETQAEIEKARARKWEREGKPHLKTYTLDDLEEECKLGKETRIDEGTKVMFACDCSSDHEDYYITLDRLGERWLAHMREKIWWTFKVEDQYRACVSKLPVKFRKTMLETHYPSTHTRSDEDAA